MTLEDLHRRFSKDATYVRACEAIGDKIEMAMHCIAAREELGLSMQLLAEQADVPSSLLTEMEALREVDAVVIASVVRRLQETLRKRGVSIEAWLHLAPPEPGTIPERRRFVISDDPRAAGLSFADRPNVVHFHK